MIFVKWINNTVNTSAILVVSAVNLWINTPDEFSSIILDSNFKISFSIFFFSAILFFILFAISTFTSHIINSASSLSLIVLEKDIANIELGQEADITGEALNGVYKGKVISIANEATKNYAANKNETTVNVILSIEDQSKKLKSGYNIKANIIK